MRKTGPVDEGSGMSQGKLLGVWSCRRRAPRSDLGMKFLPERRKTLPTVLKAFAVLVAVAVPLSMLQPSNAGLRLSAAEEFGQGAAKAFATSELGPEISGDGVLAPAARSAGIPADTTTGWDLPTSDGRMVQLVPPGGLGSGQVTAAGQVVYADAGAGYEVLAENTAIGPRMLTRISGPDKTRTVTMFVRTPADTVMLAHTNGFLTINAATPAAQTLLVFAPSEVRDSAGALVASAYITQQLQPNLYLLSQIISPDQTTAWPVYADPLGFHLPDIPNPITAAKNAVSAVAGAGEQLVNKAVQVAAPAVKTFAAANAQLASQAWSGIKAGAQYVKENPAEFAQIVAGTALVVSGVGSGVGAGLITSGASGLINKAAAANPDNKWLQAAGVAAEAATYIGPGGITKKGLQEAASLAKTGVEKLAPKLTTKADDAAKAVVPTPKPQLADEIAANPAATPKTPNAPPGSSAPEIPGAQGGPSIPGKPQPVEAGKKFTDKHKDDMTAEQLGLPQGTRGAALDQAAAQQGKNLNCTHCGRRVYRQEGKNQPGDKVPPNRAQFDHDPTPISQGGSIKTGGNIKCQGCNRGKSDMDVGEWAAEKENIAIKSRERIDAHVQQHGSPPDGVIRTPDIRAPSSAPRVTSPAQQRGNQAARGQAVTNGQRAKAVDGAHQNANTAAGNKPSSNTGNATAHHDGNGGGSHSKSSGSKNNKGNKGKGNRAKHARHGGH